MDIIKKLSLYKAIPIVTVTEQKTAQELFKYLKKNSLPVVEITLRDSRVKKHLRILILIISFLVLELLKTYLI